MSAVVRVLAQAIMHVLTIVGRVLGQAIMSVLAIIGSMIGHVLTIVGRMIATVMKAAIIAMFVTIMRWIVRVVSIILALFGVVEKESDDL